MDTFHIFMSLTYYILILILLCKYCNSSIIYVLFCINVGAMIAFSICFINEKKRKGTETFPSCGWGIVLLSWRLSRSSIRAVSELAVYRKKHICSPENRSELKNRQNTEEGKHLAWSICLYVYLFTTDLSHAFMTLNNGSGIFLFLF